MDSQYVRAVALTDHVIATAKAPDQVEDDVVVSIEAARVRRLVRERLDPVEQRVLIWHFGLAGAPKLTLREIADRMGFCAVTALNIERRAIAKLRAEYDQERAA